MPALLAGTVLVNTGCRCPDVRRSTHLVQVDALPGQAGPGYVEFYTLSSNFPFPIFLLDDQQRPILLADVGLKQGEKYSYTRHPAQVGEKLRVALPPGTHLFMVERNGERLNVPVVEGKVTPVELQYVVDDRAINEVVYHMYTHVFPPGLLAEEQPAKPVR